jgi:hypothetical protein
MRRVLLVLLVLVVLVIAGGAVFLATWDMPPPTTPMQKEVPSDRFGQ